MDTSRVNELKDRADIVKRATIEGENDRYRIGQLFYDIVDYDGEQSNAIDALEKKSIKMQEQIEDIAEGGGGGGGTSGRQRTFFYNTSDSAVPELPSVSDYDSTTDTFSHNGQVWKSTNINVQDNEVTWMIWSWFSGDALQTVDGPVKANPGGTGSNGVDANETEWVYMRTKIKMSSQIYEEWRDNLEEAKGTDGYGHKDYTHPDIQPPSWTDNPTGIDPEYKYEYASYRTSTIDSATGKRKWGETGFSAPILWSAYGERGTDGDGVEYIFYADKDGKLNPDPVNYPPGWNENTQGKWKDPEDHSKGRFVFQDNEFIADGSSWEDDPIDLSKEGYGQGSVQWVSMRKKQNNLWQAYSEPAVWSRLGKDGVVDGYTVDLSNENMPVGTSSDGTVSGWSNSSLVQVFHNSTPMTYDGSAGTTPAAGHFNYDIGTITRSDDLDHEASGFVTEKNNDTVVVKITTVTHFNEVSATVPITVYLPGGITRKLVITVFGVATGEAGQFIDMVLSSKAIRSNYAGTEVSPTTVSMGIMIGETTYWSEYPEGPAERKGYVFKYRYDEIGSFIPQAGPITIGTGHSTLTVNMYKKEGTSEILIDSENIPFVKDGKNGEDSPYYVEDYGISAYRTDHSDILESDWKPTQPIPTSEKPYVWKRSRLYNPSTHKYGDPIYVCLTGEKGPGGGGGSGDDGWMILASPANVILTQSLDNTSRFSSATVSFMAKKGNVTVNIDSISSLTGVHFDVEMSGKTVVVNSPLQLGDSYYTEGSFKVNIYVKDPDTNSTVTFEDITVPCYANLLGTWKQSVEDGTETVIAEKLSYEIFGDDVHTIEQTGQYVRGWGENTSVLTKKVNNGKNMLSLTNGWEGYQGAAVTYDNKNFGVRNANGTLYSPVFLGVEEETYCFSVYLARGNQLGGNPGYCYDSDAPTAYISELDDNGTYQSASFIEVTGDTITIKNTTYQRYYFLIPGSVVKDRYFTIYNDGNYWFYCPQLEVGTTPTEFEARTYEISSQIKQTADEIKLAVGNTGIDIDNKTIHLYGGKVTFSDREGGNTDKIWIDPDDGTLHAKNGVFSGTVNANLFYGRTLTVTTSSYTIDPSTNPYNMYLYNNPTTDSQLYLPDAATYDGLEINVFVVPPMIGMSKVVRVYAGSEKIQAMNNYHIAKDDYSDNGIVVRGYDADASLFTASYVVLREGVKYMFKSINGTWYVLDGLCNSGDS